MSSLFHVHQGRLERVIRDAFHDNKIYVNVRSEGQLKNPSTNMPLEVDIWIPDLNLCFEFQDYYHYVTTWHSHSSLHAVQKTDDAKRGLVRSLGHTLVTVPCWWDGCANSLMATLGAVRPDLFASTDIPNSFDRISISEQVRARTRRKSKDNKLRAKNKSKAYPIPFNPTYRFFPFTFVPSVGELMLASFPGPERFKNITPSSPWWVGEKYDGIRICWHPNNKQLYSRSGVPLTLAYQFIKHFPAHVFIDGEVWFGRGSFEQAQSIFRVDPFHLDWDMMRILAFDIADPVMRNHEYEKRVARLLSSVSSQDPFLAVIFRLLCRHETTLSKICSNVIDGGGEGLIVRKPKSKYVRGRSGLLYKLKTSRMDTEALVIGKDISNNRITVQMPTGTTFEVGFENVQPVIHSGDTVTLSYESSSRSFIPNNPTITRVRFDMTWQDAVDNYHTTQLNESSLKGLGIPARPVTSARKQQLRSFLEAFARGRSVDPLIAENWYQVSSSQVDPSGARLIRYNGSLVRSLVELFPEVSFDISKFVFLSRNYWHEPRNRRRLFIQLAHDRGSDPLCADSWYSLSFDEIANIKGATTVLKYYNWSIGRALVHCFPEVQFDTAKFIARRQSFQLRQARRQLIKAAIHIGINPNVRESWYAMTLSDLKPFKTEQFMGKRSRDLAEMLGLLLPELKPFDPAKFVNVRSKPQVLPVVRANPKPRARTSKKTKILEEYAKQNGFDPLIPVHWHSLSAETLYSSKEIQSTLAFYGGNLAKCLQDIFPHSCNPCKI